MLQNHRMAAEADAAYYRTKWRTHCSPGRTGKKDMRERLTRVHNRSRSGPGNMVDTQMESVI